MPPKLNVEGLWITWITAAHGAEQQTITGTEPEMPALAWLLAFGELSVVARVRR
jgi:hypothetical protein